MNLVQHVTVSSMTAVVPALMKLLRDDPQQFLPSSDTGPSVRGIEEGQHLFNNAMLMEAVPSVNKGQALHTSTEERYVLYID